jgi:hypothetical protein
MASILRVIERLHPIDRAELAAAALVELVVEMLAGYVVCEVRLHYVLLAQLALDHLIVVHRVGGTVGSVS